MKSTEYALGWTVGTDADGRGIILHTKNGGKHWEPQKFDVPGVIPQEVYFVDDKHGWTVGADAHPYGIILHTKNGGEHWEKQEVLGKYPGGFNGVSAVDEKTAWVVGDHGVILHTTDGKHWIPQKSPPIPDVLLQGVHAVDANTVWVTGDTDQGYGTILRTNKGGEHWERVGHKSQKEGDGGVPNVALLGVSALNYSTAWVVGRVESYILYTENGGNFWIDQTPEHGPRDANAVTILRNKGAGNLTGWVVEDHDEIYHTLDGQHWKHQDNPSKGNFLLDVSAVDEKTAWAVGTNERGVKGGGVILNTTDGEHWKEQYYTKNGKQVKVALSGVSFVMGEIQ